MIETIELPELVIIGLLVEAPEPALEAAIAAAWPRLLGADTGATSFLAASLGVERDSRRAIVGYLAATRSDVPEGMEKVIITPQRYLRLGHDGKERESERGFARLGAHAEAAGLRTSGLALDFGYLPDRSERRHELYLALAPEPLRLA